MEQATAKARIAMESFKTSVLLKVHGGVPAKYGVPSAPLYDVSSNAGLLVHATAEDIFENCQKSAFRMEKIANATTEHTNGALSNERNSVAALEALLAPPEDEMQVADTTPSARPEANGEAIRAAATSLREALRQHSDDEAARRAIEAERETWMITLK